MRLVIPYVCVLGFFLGSCTWFGEGSTGARPEGWSVLDHREAFFNARSVQDMRRYLQAHPNLSTHYFEIERYASDSVFAAALFQLIQNPHIDTLRKDVAVTYPDKANTLLNDFQAVFERLKSFDATFEVPRIEFIVAGLYKDVYFSDSLLIIGLDYFLGPQARYPPIGLPRYITRRYTPQHLISLYVHYVAHAYNQTDPEDQRLIADMIAAGKNYCFVQTIMPQLADTILTGYTGVELADVNAHEELIWARFIENQWLFETNHFVKEKLMGERPRVQEIGMRCPGRIGYWVGWQIVQAYRDAYPDIPLNALMAQRDAMTIFNGAKYRPKPL